MTARIRHRAPLVLVGPTLEGRLYCLAIRRMPVDLRGRPILALGSISDARPARAPQVGADNDDSNPGLDNAPTKNKKLLEWVQEVAELTTPRSRRMVRWIKKSGSA